MTTLPATHQQHIDAIAHGRRTTTLGVTIHVMAGTLAGTLSWWPQPAAKGYGAHLCVGLEESVQTADLDAVCYHAPGDNVLHPGRQDGNHQFVGIEHEGRGDDSKLTWARRRKQRKMSANRAAWILHHYGCGAPVWGVNVVPHAGFPLGGHPGCPGPNFPRTLYMLAVRRAYRNLQRSGGRRWTRG
jgi:hypothetical protein